MRWRTIWTNTQYSSKRCGVLHRQCFALTLCRMATSSKRSNSSSWAIRPSRKLTTPHIAGMPNFSLISVRTHRKYTLSVTSIVEKAVRKKNLISLCECLRGVLIIMYTTLPFSAFTCTRILYREKLNDCALLIEKAIYALEHAFSFSYESLTWHKKRVGD